MIIVGLGNPGSEYENTRHNAGRDLVLRLAKKFEFDDFEFDKKANALISSGKVGKTKINLVLPETFMNKSGNAISGFVKNKKQAKSLVVIHDDLDIALGKAKMSFNKSSGGHKGVESIMRNIKTEEFYRIRIGISKPGPKGSVKKPQGDDLINNFIVAPWKPAEFEEIKKVYKKIIEAIEILVTDSPERATGELNSSFNK